MSIFRVSLRLSLGLLLAGLSATALHAAPAVPEGRTFRNFSGLCQGFGRIGEINDMVGWDRNDVHWAALEPQPGNGNQAKLEDWGRKVLELRAKGVNFLPILSYSAPWAIDKTTRTLEYSDGRRVEYKSASTPGYALVTTYQRDSNGVWQAGQEEEIKDSALSQLAADHVQDWENYVRRVVSYLSQAPYNVKYFQIWNEAHPLSGFWKHGDSLAPYMERVHKPAAKIIHELGAKVVYGGWPCCGSVKEYVQLLDDHDAWNTIDVHDIHYFPLSAFEYIQRAAEKRGLGYLAIWQTEIGFTTDPTTVGNDYPRFLRWCLAHDWLDADTYKLFWFAAQSPDDPKAFGFQHSLLRGEQLTAHGLSMRTLASVFGDSELDLYTAPVETQPALSFQIQETQSSLEAFTVGDKRIVLAVQLVADNTARIFTDWEGDLSSIHLDHGAPMMSFNLPRLTASSVAGLRRIDLAGHSREIQLPQEGPLTFQVPIRNAPDSPAAKWISQSSRICFLIEITLK